MLVQDREAVTEVTRCPPALRGDQVVRDIDADLCRGLDEVPAGESLLLYIFLGWQLAQLIEPRHVGSQQLKTRLYTGGVDHLESPGGHVAQVRVGMRLQGRKEIEVLRARAHLELDPARLVRRVEQLALL